MNALETLKKSFSAFLTSHFEDQPAIEKMDFELNTDPQKSEFGDVNCNVALLLSKPLGKAPREIAKEIIDNFKDPAIKKIEAAGPGFLNFYLTLEVFQTFAKELLTEKDAFFEIKRPDTNYNIEFVSANPTGPLHLGHGRGGIIGDVLSNVMKFLGYKVSTEHYINDAGAQMVKLGNSFKIRCEQAIGKDAELPEDGYQGEYLKTLAEKCVKEKGDKVLKEPESFFVDYAYDHLLKELKETVKNYNIDFDTWFSERTLHTEKVVAALETLKKNGYVYEKDNAVWFKSTEFGDDKDRVLKKSDDSYTYAAVDAAYMLDKAGRGFTNLIIILGQDHHSYPKRLEGMRQALGLDNVKLEVILYQLVAIKEGGEAKKLSKRAGRIVGLADITETVGVDIARFFYLNRKADAHLDFDLDLALSETDENPVYYLQYAYVRTKSILEKAAEHKDLADITAQDVSNITEAEVPLIKKMVELKTLLENISDNYQVHLLAYYLLDFANLFHNYYHHNRVIEPETVGQSRGRLLLTTLVQAQFNRCLELMGISRPNKM